MRVRFYFQILTAVLAVTCVATAPTVLAATVQANFDGGNGTDVPDAFVGMAGDGWTGAWGIVGRNNPIVDATITDASPLNGGGNYLSFAITGTDPSTNRTSVGRSYTAGIDIGQSHSIQFQYRIDEDLSSPYSTFTHYEADKYHIFDGPTLRDGTNSGLSWMIYGHPDDTFGITGRPDNWLVYNGNNDGTGTAFDSGIKLQQGVVYNMQVDVNAVTKRWHVTIDDGTTVFDSRSVFSDGLGWRTAAATVGGTIHFNGDGNWTSEEVFDTRQFSVDGLSVTGSGLNPGGPPVGGMTSVAAHFTHGNAGGTHVDAYQGNAGDGWRTHWLEVQERADLNHRVIMPDDPEFNPLKSEGGAYLSFSATTNASGNSRNAVARDYKTTADPGINWAREHTIQFSV
ncbi:MAG: hypothetical protein GX621_05840, partial [Pirellulaceae bacterium]|nr:hypothetical protein [Pirellulaceae bacterium]